MPNIAMSARYAFWRDQKGQPLRGSGNDFAPTKILEHYGLSSSVNPSGEVSFTGWEFFTHNTVLNLAFVVISPDGDELNEADAREIASKALIAQCLREGGNKPIPPAEFLKRADELAAAHFLRPTLERTIVGSLSVSPLPPDEFEFGGCKIRPLSSRKGYGVPEGVRNDPVLRAHLEETKYQWVAVSTDCRSDNEAAHRAFNALAVIRAIWSLQTSYGAWSFKFDRSSPEPITRIRSGPFYTLHDEHNVVSELFWREDGAEKDIALFAPKMGWTIIQQNSSIFLSRLALFGYRTELEELLARYASALDQTNHDVAFLQLWAILERITDTVGAQYEKTVDRATWDEPDRQYAKEFLSLMRMHRNRYVHASVSTSEPDQVTYLLKMFVDSHLITLVRNSYRVSTLVDYAAMLSTPVQLQKLEADEQRTATSLRIRREHMRPKTSEDSAAL